MMDFRDPNLIHQFTNIRQIPRGNRTIPQPRNGPGAGGGAGGMPHYLQLKLLSGKNVRAWVSMDFTQDKFSGPIAI